MLSAFVGLSRPAMTTWYSMTRAFAPLVDLMLHRLTRTRETYARIKPNFRPTALQEAIPHPAVFDWLPFPSLRDNMILHHSEDGNLDSIVADLSASYVFETQKILTMDTPGYSSGMTFCVGAWDLAQAMQSKDIEPSTYSDSSSGNGSGVAFCLPAPSSDALFSKTYAPLAFRALSLDDGLAACKISPDFFIRHPELYDSKLVASGFRLRPTNPKPVPEPTPLSKDVIGRYEDSARWAFYFHAS